MVPTQIKLFWMVVSIWFSLLILIKQHNFEFDESKFEMDFFPRASDTVHISMSFIVLDLFTFIELKNKMRFKFIVCFQKPRHRLVISMWNRKLPFVAYRSRSSIEKAFLRSSERKRENSQTYNSEKLFKRLAGLGVALALRIPEGSFFSVSFSGEYDDSPFFLSPFSVSERREKATTKKIFIL